MERRLIRDHIKKKDKKKRHPPRRPSGPVKRLLLRQRNHERNIPGEAVNQKQQNHRRKHEEELDLVHEIFKHGLIVYVPGKTQHEKQD
ncbi:hypothetical protein CCACVL1_17459 [Corchorus capsularis]|uniref:Uncharacterized protein n=1 Tax=Corchorus capsularis TaxID=210143 RepID=A0A1R3HRU5_COCAP|nr:hypothetical protein CCACVL1_17459 [Corchorus capsularis]